MLQRQNFLIANEVSDLDQIPNQQNQLYEGIPPLLFLYEKWWCFFSPKNTNFSFQNLFEMLGIFIHIIYEIDTHDHDHQRHPLTLNHTLAPAVTAVVTL